MNDNKNTVLKINLEIETLEKKISKFKSRVPHAIIGGILLCFTYPYLPRKYGRKAMIEEWEYHNAVIIMGIAYFSIYIISYYYVVEKNKKTIESLNRTKFSLLNKPKSYKRTIKQNEIKNS